MKRANAFSQKSRLSRRNRRIILLITERKFWLYSEKRYVFKTPVLVFGQWADTIQRACEGRTSRGVVRMDQIDRFGDGGLCPDTNDKIVFVVSKDY